MTEKNSFPLWKKLLLAAGVGFVLLLGLIVAIPVFIKVDDYRPTLVKIANEQLNGSLELGPLSLSLWGQVKIDVAGVQLTDAKGQKLVSAKEVYFHIPFSSLLTGAPQITFKLEKPEIRVIKNAAGKMNVLTLVKETSSGASKPEGKESASPKSESSAGATKALPSLVTHARLGIEMRHANFLYRDEVTQLTSEVKDLTLVVKNLSMTRATELEIWADLDTKMGKTMQLKGPMKIKGEVEPKFNGGEFQNALVRLYADLDGVEIILPGLFEKKSGVATNMKLNLHAGLENLQLEECLAKFFNVEIAVNGSVRGFSQKNGPNLEIKLTSNEIPFAPWSDLVPMLKQYQLAGSAKLGAELSGTASAPRYRAEVTMKEVTAKAPNLKAQPRFDGNIKVVTDNVENFSFTMKAPGNDLKLVGRVNGFKKPKISVDIASTSLDLDSLIEFPKLAAPASNKDTKTSAAVPVASSGSGTGAESVRGEAPADFDKLLDPMRGNEVILGTVANVKFDLALIKIYGIKMTDVGGQMNFHDLALAVQAFKMGIWNGNVKAAMDLQMKPKTPQYRFNAEVKGLNLQQAVESQLALFKNTILGKADFKIEGQGTSFNPEPAKRNLNAKGNLRVEQASFATIDISKMVGDGINKSINEISAKIPALKGKTINTGTNIESKYALVSSDFTIGGGRFSAPNFVAKAEANKGIDLKGDTSVGLLDYSLRADWEVIDTYNLTHARDLSVEEAGVKVEHVLADGDGPFKFPVKVGGTCFSPQFSYEAIPEALGKVAINNIGRAAAGKAKAELTKRLQEQAPKQLQNALKGLFGK